MATNFDKVVEQVKALTAAEQRRLRDLLDAWLVPLQAAPAEDQGDQELLQEGVLDQVPPPITDYTTYQHRKPVEVKGKPVSETIIEERR